MSRPKPPEPGGGSAGRAADGAGGGEITREPVVGVLSRALGDLPDPLPLWVARAPGPKGRELAVTPPGSKSLSNRAVLLAAMSRGESVIEGALIDADDAARMLAALETLGAKVWHEGGGRLRIAGVGGRWRLPREGVSLNLNNAGTATRFLTAAAALADAPVVIDGNARMRERPIAELAEVLPALGARVEHLGKEGYPPLRIIPARAMGKEPAAPRVIEMATTRSSQFISALLLVGAFMPGGLTLRLKGYITSVSYVRMTVGLLSLAGAAVRTSEDYHVIRVRDREMAGAAGEPVGIDGFRYHVEPDASGATYFWTAAALLPGLRCRVMGLGPGSLQGDAGYPALLERMGAAVDGSNDPAELSVTGPASLRPILADMSEMPDAAMSLAAAASFAKGSSVLRGLETLRVKETDRIEATRRELAKIGVKVETSIADDPDAIVITPPEGGVDCSASAPAVEFDTYDDHRMAMSMSLIALRRPNCAIRDPKCVAKTYPGYWAEFGRILG